MNIKGTWDANGILHIDQNQFDAACEKVTCGNDLAKLEADLDQWIGEMKGDPNVEAFCEDVASATARLREYLRTGVDPKAKSTPASVVDK